MSRFDHIAVVGGNGQLGMELRRLLSGKLTDADPRWIFYPRELFDLQNMKMPPPPLLDHQPRLLLNLAAFTDVDGAETDPDTAFVVNAAGPGKLAAHCHAIGCRMIHISTDYVYGGAGNRPFTENQPIHPVGVYARSKADGEQEVLQNDPDAIIIRTSWLYSNGPRKNFLTTMKRLGAELPEVRVVNDQLGTPTFAGDLAETLVHIAHRAIQTAEEAPSGIYNYSNEGAASWYDFAWSIMDQCGYDCKVVPVPTSEFPRPASRPAYSLMSKQKIRETFDLEIPHWQDGLRRCLMPNS